MSSAAADDPLLTPAAPSQRMRWPALLSLGSGVVNQVALLLTGILAARALAPDGRGTQALLTLLPLVLSQVGTLGLPTAVVYFAGNYEASSRALAALLRRPAAMQTFATALVQLAILLLIAQVHGGVDRGAAALTLAVLPVMIVHEYAIALLQGQHRLVAFQVLRTAPNVLYALALGSAIAFAAEVDLLRVIACWFLALAVGAALSCGIAWRGLSHSGHDVDPGLATQLRSFGRRSLLGAISPLEGLRVDQLIAGFLLGPAALGLYVSASAFTGLTRTLSQSVGVIAYPDVARRHLAVADDSAARRGVGYVALVAAATTVVAVAVVAAAPWLVTAAFGPEFAGAAQATRILIVAGAILAVRRVAGDVARGMGRAAVNSWAEAATLATLVVGVLTFGSNGSPEAAAWAVLVAACCGLLVVALLVGRPRHGKRSSVRHAGRHREDRLHRRQENRR